MIALVRRWFWARKPEAGFALAGFPATLLQAKVFDEWLKGIVDVDVVDSPKE
jgi:adenylate kinase